MRKGDEVLNTLRSELTRRDQRGKKGKELGLPPRDREKKGEGIGFCLPGGMAKKNNACFAQHHKKKG